MFAEQLEERQAFGYPPFVRMIKLSLKHKEFSVVQKTASTLAEDLRSVFGKRIFGPQAPLVGRISNYYIIDLLIKIEKRSSFSKARNILGDILKLAEDKGYMGSVRTTIDVDPF
jgi:primosomal protein N' (replication factor Y)